MLLDLTVRRWIVSRPVCRSAATSSASRFLFEREVSRKIVDAAEDRFVREERFRREWKWVYRGRQTKSMYIALIIQTKQGLQPFANQPRCKDVCLFFFRSNFSRSLFRSPRSGIREDEITAIETRIVPWLAFQFLADRSRLAYLSLI